MNPNLHSSLTGVMLTAALFLSPKPGLHAQSVTAPNQCTPTPTFPAGSLCAANETPITTFSEDFDSGFGQFTEDAPPAGSTNDLTISTSGDTPSFGTGPELTASCTNGPLERAAASGRDGGCAIVDGRGDTE